MVRKMKSRKGGSGDDSTQSRGDAVTPKSVSSPQPMNLSVGRYRIQPSRRAFVDVNVDVDG